MGGESVERLMEIILQMKMNVSHINETLQQQTFEICQQLSAIFGEQSECLERYVGAIDARLKDCACQFDAYQRLYASLAEARSKLEHLGAAPEAIPGPLPSETLEGVLAWRLDNLREQGKI